MSVSVRNSKATGFLGAGGSLRGVPESRSHRHPAAGLLPLAPNQSDPRCGGCNLPPPPRSPSSWCWAQPLGRPVLKAYNICATSHWTIINVALMSAGCSLPLEIRERVPTQDCPPPNSLAGGSFRSPSRWVWEGCSEGGNKASFILLLGLLYSGL